MTWIIDDFDPDVFDLAIQMELDALMAKGLTLDQALAELRWVRR